MRPLEAPKPGTHPLARPLPPRATPAPFRDIARDYARAAAAILSDQGPDVDEPSTDDYLAAIAYALTSIACTDVAPPARFRPRADHSRAGVAR